MNIKILFLFTILFVLPVNAKSRLKDHIKPVSINLQDSAANWDLVLDSSFFKNDFYWIGEIHAVNYSYAAKWVLFKKIHKQTSFRYYLLEGSYISEVYLNKYLASGDEKYLKMNFDATNGTMGCNMDSYDFYRKLYAYNKQLFDDKKIVIDSIDIEHQYRETHKYIRSLFQKTELPADSTDFINVFMKTKENYRCLYKQLNIDLRVDSIKYKTILQSHYPEFKYLVRNINFLFEAKAASNWDDTRDSLMFENYKIRNQSMHFKNNKVFAYFGTSHCYLERTRSVKWIASLIKNSDPSLKSVSTMMQYSNCKAMRPVWMLPKVTRFFIPRSKKYFNARVGYKNKFKDLSNGDYCLLSLYQYPELINTFQLRDGKLANKVLTDYFQYVITISNSPGSKPYK